MDDLLDERLFAVIFFRLDFLVNEAGGLRQRLYRRRSAYPPALARAWASFAAPPKRNLRTYENRETCGGTSTG